MERFDYLRTRGYVIIYAWYCQFMQLLNQNIHLQKLRDEIFGDNSKKAHFGNLWQHKRYTSGYRLLEAVELDLFFGVLEVDIQV